MKHKFKVKDLISYIDEDIKIKDGRVRKIKISEESFKYRIERKGDGGIYYELQEEFWLEEEDLIPQTTKEQKERFQKEYKLIEDNLNKKINDLFNKFKKEKNET